MTNTTCGATRVLAMCAVVLLAGWPLHKDADRLNPRIGPAKPLQYRSILDAKDWKNPYVVIRRDSIEVVASGLRSGRKTIAPTDLQRTLLDLPVTAWPYGRVAAVQEIGIRAPGDDKPIAHNLDVTPDAHYADQSPASGDLSELPCEWRRDARNDDSRPNRSTEMVVPSLR